MAGKQIMEDGLTALAELVEGLRQELVTASANNEPIDFGAVQSIGMQMDIVVTALRSALAKGLLDGDITNTVGNATGNVVQARDIAEGVNLGGAQ